MDTKKAIEALVKIARNQQKIINKLAQALPAEAPPAEGHGAAPLTQEYDTNKVVKAPARALIAALPQGFFAQKLVNIEEHGNEMVVGFKPGQKTQANYDLILKTLQDLTNKGGLNKAYSLKAV